MARPPAFTDEQLLAAARAVFLERGIQATTAEVARRAGVAEGTLFYRFKTKAALFQAALRQQMRAPRWLEGLEARLGQAQEVGPALEALGLEVLAHFRAAVPLLMMSWSNPSPGPAPAEPAGPSEEPVPLRSLRALAAGLQAHMDAGRLRRSDPEVAARVLLGSLLHHAFQELVLPPGLARPPPPERYVREVVALLLEGLAPGGAPAPTPTHGEDT